MGNEYETMEMLQKIKKMTGLTVGQSLYSEFPFIKTGYFVAKKEPRKEAGEPDIPTPMTKFISVYHTHKRGYFLLDDYVNGRLYLLFNYLCIEEAVYPPKSVLRKALDVVLTEMEKLYPTDNFYAVIEESACMRVFMRNLSRDTIVVPAGFFHLQNIEKVTGHRVSFEQDMFPFEDTSELSFHGTENKKNYVPTALKKFISMMDRHGIGNVVVEDQFRNSVCILYDRKVVEEDSIVRKQLQAASQPCYRLDNISKGGMHLLLQHWSPEARVVLDQKWCADTKTAKLTCDQCGQVTKKRKKRSV